MVFLLWSDYLLLCVTDHRGWLRHATWCFAWYGLNVNCALLLCLSACWLAYLPVCCMPLLCGMGLSCVD